MTISNRRVMSSIPRVTSLNPQVVTLKSHSHFPEKYFLLASMIARQKS